MGRKSIAQLFYEEYEEQKASPEDGQWMVIYDFPQMKPQIEFWRNIHRLKSLSGVGGLVQYSVFMTPDRNAALTMLRLVQHYDGEVLAYKLGEEIELVYGLVPLFLCGCSRHCPVKVFNYTHLLMPAGRLDTENEFEVMLC